MKRHLHWAEQQEPPSNITKYCACHEKWLSWLILVTHETSSTQRGATGITFQLQLILRLARKEFSWLVLVTHETSSTKHGATGVTFQRHHILRLPRKMTLMIDPRHTCNVQYTARSNRNHLPTSPNIAPGTKKNSHDWSSSRLETSSTKHGATGVTFQRHQIVCLPLKMNFMIDPRHTRNIQYTARSNRKHLPTSPNIVPATKNDSQKYERNLLKTTEALFTSIYSARPIRA